MLLTLLSLMEAKRSRCRTEDPSSEERGSCDDLESQLAGVVLLLVNSGHVGVQQVGRLAQVSKELHQVTLDDHIWASFCRRHWIGTRHIPKRCVEKTGHRCLYRQWCSPLVRRRPPSRLNRLYRQCSGLFTQIERRLCPPMCSADDILGPPTCSTDEIQLHVLVKYKGVPVLSQVIEGEGMKSFCEIGSITLRLHKAMNVGLAYWEVSREEAMLYLEGPNTDGLEVGSRPKLDPASMDVTIHYYRTTDSIMACVLSSAECAQHYFPIRLHPLPDLKVDVSKGETTGVLGVGSYRVENFQGLPLRKTKQAYQLRRRFPDPIDLTAYVVFKMDKQRNFVMTELFIDIMKKPKPGELMVKRFKSSEEKEHGVSLLHILSELPGV